MSISKFALACSLTLGAMTLCLSPLMQTAAASDAKHRGATAKQAEPEEAEPDTAGSIVTELNCEMGNKITLFANADDQSHIALRWKKRLHRLTRVGTTTGALRFENRRYGLIWIGIPAKGMLLDSKQNRQLANECRNADQLKPSAIEAPAGVKKI